MDSKEREIGEREFVVSWGIPRFGDFFVSKPMQKPVAVRMWARMQNDLLRYGSLGMEPNLVVRPSEPSTHTD